jgi:hypothetical protein
MAFRRWLTMSTYQFVLSTVILMGLLNFASFAVESTRWGGGVPRGLLFSAIPAEGPYLLDDHGRFTEVSRETYVSLLWQGRVAVLATPLLMLCTLLLKRDENREASPS